MKRDEIINHELGHGIIAYIFHGDYYYFKGIKMDIDEKLNSDDSAYTISIPVENLNIKVDKDNHLAASVDGLLLLGGIAGLTIFANYQKPKESSSTDYRSIFDFRGAQGDFDIINRGNRPYGWYLKNALKSNQNKIDVRHSRILNVLMNLFACDDILHAVKKLRQELLTKKELTFEDFDRSFEPFFITQTKNKLIEFVKTGLGKPILVD